MSHSEREAGDKVRVLITGSSNGLGLAAARTLLAQGHEVVTYVRSQGRMPAVGELVGHGTIATICHLSDLGQIRDLAQQVNAIGWMDAVIHNAGVISGAIQLVNVVASYLLTALVQQPSRLIHLSSSMHSDGIARLDRMDWSCQREAGSYSDSRLFVTTLAAAVARRWPDVYSNAVNPGWVPTRMGGGLNAPEDLRLGHLTQEWLATSKDPRTITSGGYWHHQKRQQRHPAANDMRFQDQLLAKLARTTGTNLA